MRSEEKLTATTRPAEAGYARLKTEFRITETRTYTVEATRDEVRLVIISPTEHQADELENRPASTDSSQWMTLSEQRVLISKETVPVERARLEVTTIPENHTITDLICKGQVDLIDGTLQRPTEKSK